MRNSIKLLVAAMVVIAAVSCKETRRSSSSFVQVTPFDMSDYSIESYFVDDIMFASRLSWDDVCFYNAVAEDVNKGFEGGFLVSVRKAKDDLTSDQSMLTSADPNGGANGSNGYAVFKQTSRMPDPSITYNLTNLYSAMLSSYGCDVCNTLYNKRIQEEGLISPGDYLKVIFEFYNGAALVGSIEKYLIDYVSGAELKMENEWVGWSMTSGNNNTTSTISNFDSVKIKVETSGKDIDPAFCVDNYCVHMDVEY